MQHFLLFIYLHNIYLSVPLLEQSSHLKLTVEFNFIFEVYIYIHTPI
jgi:hypothetical protein